MPTNLPLPTARCVDGRGEASCLDVSQCRATATRPAIATAFDFYGKWTTEHERRGPNMRMLAGLARQNGADAVFLLPEPRLQRNRLADREHRELLAWGWKLVHTDWIEPPLMHPSIGKLVAGTGCCGARIFHKIHAFGLAQYDGVVFLDTDVAIAEASSLRIMLDCAASGFVLTTRGQASPTNGGLWIFPPSARLERTVLDTLARTEVRPADGWNHSGWGAFGRPRRGLEAFNDCFGHQGFSYWFFFQSSARIPFDPAPTGRRPAGGRGAGAGGRAGPATELRPAMLDSCIWNSQPGVKATCTGTPRAHVRVVHAATGAKHWLRTTTAPSPPPRAG